MRKYLFVCSADDNMVTRIYQCSDADVVRYCYVRGCELGRIVQHISRAQAAREMRALRRDGAVMIVSRSVCAAN